jgi:hypothetical protein
VLKELCPKIESNNHLTEEFITYGYFVSNGSPLADFCGKEVGRDI